MPFIKQKLYDKEDGPCNHPEHNPPAMIVLKSGEYTWKCPNCGKEQSFTIYNGFNN